MMGKAFLKHLQVNFSEDIDSLLKEQKLSYDSKRKELNDSQTKLKESLRNFHAQKKKIWIYVAVYGVFFGIIAVAASLALYYQSKAFFDREVLDNKLMGVMNNYNVKDALADEVFLVAYSYNYGEPRFYTKRNANDKAIKIDYDVSLEFAARATSASPLYFEPVFRNTLRGKQRQQELLIDGGIIASNPSMLATIYAKGELEKSSVRTVSIGFRPKKEPAESNLQEMNAFEWLPRMEQILIDSESTSNHYFTERMLSQPGDHYTRFEHQTTITSYDASTFAIEHLAIEGEVFLATNLKKIQQEIAQILQEKYG